MNHLKIILEGTIYVSKGLQNILTKLGSILLNMYNVHRLAKYKLEFIENLTIERARRVAPTNAFKPRIILAKFLKYSDK